MAVCHLPAQSVTKMYLCDQLWEVYNFVGLGVNMSHVGTEVAGLRRLLRATAVVLHTQVQACARKKKDKREVSSS